MPITVAIVEDNAGICEELRFVISRAPDLRLAAVCRNAAAALRTLPDLAPEVILMDIQLPGQSGLECTVLLKAALPHAQILMFTIHDENEYIMKALEAGAIGYILKSAPSEDIIAAIREAKNGGAPMTGEVARKVLESFHRGTAADQSIESLTFREREVVQLLAQGSTDKQVADQLAISLQTVNSHLKHIYAKFGVHSRTEVVIKYLRGTSRTRAVVPPVDLTG